MRVLTFRLSGMLGHFKVPLYTSTSPSFPVPPKTALMGLLGAILGLGREEYIDRLRGSLVSVSNGRVRKLGMTFNTLGKYRASVSQTYKEILMDPSFTVRVHVPDTQLMDELIERVRECRPVYNVVLGSADMSADMEYVGVFEAEESASMGESSFISSTVWSDFSVHVAMNPDVELSYSMVREQDTDRNPTDVGSLVVDLEGNPIYCRLIHGQWSIGDEDYCFY